MIADKSRELFVEILGFEDVLELVVADLAHLVRRPEVLLQFI